MFLKEKYIEKFMILIMTHKSENGADETRRNFKNHAYQEKQQEED